jgi:apolipoprotein N-acyltransferase
MHAEADKTSSSPGPSVHWSVGVLLACVASGGLLYVGTFSRSWHVLAWVSLLPFAYLLSPRTPAVVAYSGAFLGAAVFHSLGLWWLCVCLDGILAPVWFLATLAGAACCTAVLFLGRQLVRRTMWPMAVALPLIWVTFEYLRYHLFAAAEGNGLPILWLGLSLLNYEHLVQIADLGGVLAGTWLVASVNGALCDVLAGLLGPGGYGKRFPLIASALAVGALSVLAAWLYGEWRLNQPLDGPGPTIALVTGTLSGEANVRGLADLPVCSSKAVGASADFDMQPISPGIDLFVWPEIAFRKGVTTVKVPGKQATEAVADDEGAKTLHSVAKELHAPVLVGTEFSRRRVKRL